MYVQQLASDKFGLKSTSLKLSKRARSLQNKTAAIEHTLFANGRTPASKMEVVCLKKR